MTVDPEIRALLDKQAITETLLRYFRGVDRLDEELVRSCFHPDATDEHGSFSGGRDELIEWAFRLLRRYDTTFHHAGNILVDLVADHRARSETYGLAHHRSGDGEPRHNLITAFRFIDDFERRDGTWRIARRVSTTEMSWVDDEVGRWAFPDHFTTGHRDRTDAVYAPWTGAGGG